MRRVWLVLVLAMAVGVLPNVAWAAQAAERGPARPLVRQLSVVLSPDEGPRLPVYGLWLQSDLGPDTVALELAITDQLGRQTIASLPDTTTPDYQDLRLAPGPLQIEIVAIDHEGRRSEPSSYSVQAEVREPYRCGLGPALLIVFVPTLFVVAALVLLLVRAWLRGRSTSESAESIPVVVAHHVARRVRQRTTSGGVAGLVACASALLFGHSLVAALIVVVTFLSLGSLLAARRVLRELDRDGARAVLQGTLLIVRSTQGQAHLATTRRVIERARRDAVPASIARRASARE